MQAIMDAIAAVAKFLTALIGSGLTALIEALALILAALVELLLTVVEGLRQFGLPSFGARPYQPGTTFEQTWDSFRPLWRDLARWIFQD